MDWIDFGWGILIGVAVAAPIGPVNIICLQRTLQSGVLVGFLSGLGAAVGDSVFGFVAAFGVTTVSDFLFSHEQMLQTIGGLFLLGLATHIWQDHPHIEVPRRSATVQVARNFVTTFVLTITNPMTILGFLAIFASAGLGRVGDNLTSASLLVAGVFSGSALWWLTLTSGARLLKGRMNDTHLLIINRTSAVIVAFFGLFALGRNFV